MKNLTIYCKDFDLTDAIKEYVEDKFSSLYKYLNQEEDMVSFNLRMGKVTNHHNNGKIFYADVAIKTPEKNYGGRMEAESLYAALDLLKDELAGNIKHYREKARTVSRHEAQKLKEELHAEVFEPVV